MVNRFPDLALPLASEVALYDGERRLVNREPTPAAPESPTISTIDIETARKPALSVVGLTFLLGSPAIEGRPGGRHASSG